jgi:mRNA interferase RelE/StbE
VYSVELSSRAASELRACPPELREELLTALEGLAASPRPAGCRKLSGRLAGTWRIRVRSYRALYDIDDGRRSIHVVKIGPRKSVYR